MAIESIIFAINAEIVMLEQARSLLTNDGKLNPVPAKKASAKVSATQPKKRTMSLEARKRIGDALRKRWAAKKKANAVTPAKATKKAVKKAAPVTAKKTAPKTAVKRTMSPEARARIAEAQRKRWAAAKRATKKAAPKKAAKSAPAVSIPEAPKAEAVS
jgi:hypothetical protein